MSDPYGRPAVVIDNGTGYTKMGYAGNVEPQYIVPTVAGFKAQQVTRTRVWANTGQARPDRAGQDARGFRTSSLRENRSLMDLLTYSYFLFAYARSQVGVSSIK